MNSIKFILLLFFRRDWIVWQPLQRLIPYLRAILRSAISWIRKATSHNLWRSKNTYRRNSSQVALDVVIPSVLPVVSTPPERTGNETAVPAPPSASYEHPSTLSGSTSCQNINSDDPYAPQPLSIIAENLVAITSQEFQRYERNHKVKKDFNEKYIIKPLTKDFSAPDPPRNWTPYTHPEGALYFYDETRGILTDIYLYDDASHKNLEKMINNIVNYTLQPGKGIGWPTEDNSVQLILELRQTGRYGYYFVDHNHRCLFWPEEFDFIDFINEVKVKHTISHVGTEMLSQYWVHNELFPHIRGDPDPALVDELRDTIIHAIGDTLTSKTSTTPYTLESLQKMSALVKDMYVNECKGVGTACMLYRLMHTFAHEKFLNLYGERGARLNKTQSIHPERPRTYLLKILSPFLLYGPETHYSQLVELSTDSLVNELSWTHILGKLIEEWKEFTLYGTVLLNANVAFLAIQSIDTAAPPHRRTDVQRASYFSIVTSIGAIILGLLLVRQHHVVLKMDFIANRSVSSWGLETLALLYSLPYGLLMWSMLSFLIAFSLLWFKSGDLITIILLGSCWVMLGLLLLWCISSSFEHSAYYYPWIFRKWNGWVDRIAEERVESETKSISSASNMC